MKRVLSVGRGVGSGAGRGHGHAAHAVESGRAAGAGRSRPRLEKTIASSSASAPPFVPEGDLRGCCGRRPISARRWPQARRRHDGPGRRRRRHGRVRSSTPFRSSPPGSTARSSKRWRRRAGVASINEDGICSADAGDVSVGDGQRARRRGPPGTPAPAGRVAVLDTGVETTHPASWPARSSRKRATRTTRRGQRHVGLPRRRGSAPTTSAAGATCAAASTAAITAPTWPASSPAPTGPAASTAWRRARRLIASAGVHAVRRSGDCGAGNPSPCTGAFDVGHHPRPASACSPLPAPATSTGSPRST